MNYEIRGLHCKECAADLEDKINQIYGQKVAEIDYSEQKVQLAENIDKSKLKKIFEFEKVLILDPEQKEKESNKTEHSHSYGHNHHTNEMSEKNTKIVFFLNLVFSIVEIIAGFLFSSQAILADAVHDFGDALSIGLAWLLERMSLKEADDEYTFGYRRLSPLAGIITGSILIVGSVLILFHSIPSLFNATPVNYQGMFWLSIVAIAVNVISMRLMSGSTSKNEQFLSLHMLEDVMGWVAVLIVSIVLNFTNWYFLDPLLSIGLAIFILYTSIPMFIDTFKIFFETTPHDVDVKYLEERLLEIKGVEAISHFHVWSFDGQENFASVTVATDLEGWSDVEEMKREVLDLLGSHELSHPTVEIVYDRDGILEKL